jgi:cyclohexa-1,5-dienecarbonyl-CoA hydratase
VNTNSDRVAVRQLDDGRWWRVTFGLGRGNILDVATMTSLSAVFREARQAQGLKAIVLEGAGAEFSFGASVQEHLPADVHGMLAAIGQLVLNVLDSRVVTLAAVRGRCLGGGLELASVCHRVIASQQSTFGQPEIALGLFAPIASIVLPERIGRAHAEDLCLTGRLVTGAEALSMGLVDEVTPDDPAEAALAWARTHLAGRSASSLRLAVAAVRTELALRLRRDLPTVEAVYMNELMSTRDGTEGLNAFLDKRAPQWRDE